MYEQRKHSYIFDEKLRLTFLFAIRDRFSVMYSKIAQIILYKCMIAIWIFSCDFGKSGRFAIGVGKCDARALT